MTTRFEEIDGQEVKEAFPRFYDKRGRFFEIVHKEQPIGFLGIRPCQMKEERKEIEEKKNKIEVKKLFSNFSLLSSDSCELEVFIFPHERNTLTKGIVLAVLDFPKSLNFKRCLMTTTRQTLVKLFHAMRKYHIMDKGFFNQKHIFVKEFP